MKYLLIVLTWGGSLFSCLQLSMLSVDSSGKDIALTLLPFLIMLLIIIAQIFYVLLKKRNSVLRDVFNPVMSFLHFLFLLFRNHVNFGYGNTLGILGYNKQVGVLSCIKMSKTAAFICLCIIFSIIGVLFVSNYHILLKKTNCKITKLIIITTSVEIIGVLSYGIFFYLNNNRLSGWFLLSIILFWIVYFFITLKIFCIRAKNCSSNKNGIVR